MGEGVWGLAAELYLVIIVIEVVEKFQTIIPCVWILDKLHIGFNLLELVIIGIF